MTDKPKGQRMFAVIDERGRRQIVAKNSKYARLIFADQYPFKPGELWEAKWKRISKGYGYRIVPVIVTIEDRHE